MPACAIIGLADPLEPISDVVACVGAAVVDPNAYPILATPLWAYSPDDFAGLKLPLLP